VPSLKIVNPAGNKSAGRRRQGAGRGLAIQLIQGAGEALKVRPLHTSMAVADR